MKFFTPERKANFNWWKENEGRYAQEYDGKYVLIHKRAIVASGNSQKEVMMKADNLGIPQKDFIIVMVKSAIDYESERVWG